MSKRFKHNSRYYTAIFIEGSIGSGKSSIAKRIRNKFKDYIYLEDDFWGAPTNQIDHGEELTIYTGHKGDLHILLTFLKPKDILIINLDDRNSNYSKIISELEIVSFGKPKNSQGLCVCDSLDLFRYGCKCGGK